MFDFDEIQEEFFRVFMDHNPFMKMMQKHFASSFKDHSYDIYAPIAGKCMDISCCKDIAFSQKSFGDGFMIEPIDNVIYAPCYGKITSIFPTKHAYGIEMINGKEIMLHIGLETVKMKKGFFRTDAKVGDYIKPGKRIADFDMNEAIDNGIDMSTIVVLIDSKNLSLKHLNKTVSKDDVITSVNSDENH